MSLPIAKKSSLRGEGWLRLPQEFELQQLDPALFTTVGILIQLWIKWQVTMEKNRRDILKMSSIGIIGGIAGCSSSVSTPEPNQDNNDASAPTTEPPVDATFDGLGETAVYERGDDSRLRLTPAKARFEDLLLTARSGRISSRSPENPNDSFLLIRIDLENTGSEAVFTPSDLSVRLNGNQYDSSYVSPPNGESYANYNEIHPGSSQSGWAVFEVPPATEASGELIIQGSGVNAATATWDIDLSSFNRQAHDYTGIGFSSGIEFGTEPTRYSIIAADIENSNGYTYSQSGDYELEAEPSSGNRFALVYLQVENTGDGQVSVPTTFDMSLIAGNSQIDAGRYRKSDEAYEGGEIASSIVREGYVQFEVPESATVSEFRVDLTRDVTATWTIEG